MLSLKKSYDLWVVALFLCFISDNLSLLPNLVFMKNLLPSPNEVNITGALWIERQDGSERFLGKGRVQLLELIIEHGSISKAAKAMNMSYKRAWDLINSMNSQAITPFVITQIGGKRGGGAIVTPEGLQAIENYKALQNRFQAFLLQENQKLFS